MLSICNNNGSIGKVKKRRKISLVLVGLIESRHFMRFSYRKMNKRSMTLLGDLFRRIVVNLDFIVFSLFWG